MDRNQGRASHAPLEESSTYVWALGHFLSWKFLLHQSLYAGSACDLAFLTSGHPGRRRRIAVPVWRYSLAIDQRHDHPTRLALRFEYFCPELDVGNVFRAGPRRKPSCMDPHKRPSTPFARNAGDHCGVGLMYCRDVCLASRNLCACGNISPRKMYTLRADWFGLHVFNLAHVRTGPHFRCFGSKIWDDPHSTTCWHG